MEKIKSSAKIYVAGHRGLVGNAICKLLQSRGQHNIITRTHAELDLCNQQAVKEFFQEQRPEYVFLAAAKVGGIKANNSWPVEFIRDNLLIETNIIDNAYKNGTNKLLFLGSSCIYPRMAPQPIKESSLLGGPLETTNQWYAIAKIAGIKLCQAYRQQYGFNAISLMPTNLYGPGDNFDLDTSHVLPALIRKFHLAKLVMAGDLEGIARDENTFGPLPEEVRQMLGLDEDRTAGKATGKDIAVTIWGSGKAYREFLHVDDLAGAALFLMDQYDNGDIINVGTGEEQTIKKLAEMVCSVVGFTGSIQYDTLKPEGTPRKCLDISRLNDLGWGAEKSLLSGIQESYSWYQAG